MQPVQDYRFELARLTDAARLATMSGELVEHGLVPSWGAERIRSHIRHAESVVLTARVPGPAIAGFAIMRYGDSQAHLNLLAVEPAHRRRGVGGGLVRWLEETALTAGTFLIGLELREANAGGRAFYAALGYRELARVSGYYQGVETAIRMQRDLRPAEAPGP
jgi:ribosomal-protein-alanine N-acetyltransferase